MKLPGWQASISTAMPRKSPALQGAPAMVRPAVQRFVPLDNPNDYIQLGRAKAGKYEAIGGAVSTAINVGVKLIEEDEAARANNAIAQYSEEMAKWTTEQTLDPRLYVEEENPDGTTSRVYQWEDAEDRFEAKAKEVQARLMEENDFKTSRARLAIDKGFTANDEQFRTKVQRFVGDKRTERGRMADVEALDTYERTGNIVGIEALRNEMIQSGRWNPAQAYSTTDAAIRTASYNQTVQQIQMHNTVAGVSTLMDEIQAGKGWAENMSVQQRQQVMAEGQRRMTGLYMEGLRTAHDTLGLPGAYKKLQDLSKGGHEQSGAIDEVHHNKMIGQLKTAVDRMAKIDEELHVGQSTIELAGRYGKADMTQEDLTALAVALGPGQTKNRKLIDASANALAHIPGQKFYENEQVGVLLANGVRVGYIAKPLVTRLQNDINNGSLAAAERVRQLEAAMPGAVNLDERARNKLEFIDSYRATGLYDPNDPMKMQMDFAKIENRPANQKKMDVAMAQARLKDEGTTKLYRNAAEELGYVDDDLSYPDAVKPGTDAEIVFSETFTSVLPFVNYDTHRAARAATQAVASIHGNTTAYDESTPVTEYKSPEAMEPAPGFKKGQPNPYYDQQMKDHLAEYTERTGVDYEVDNVKRVWSYQGEDGKNYWTYVDLNGVPLVMENGKHKLWEYNKVPDDVAEVQKTRSIDRQSDMHISDMSRIAANSSFEVYQFDDVAIDGATGRISPSTPAAVAINESRWNGLDENGKDMHNSMYMQSYVALLRESSNDPAMAGIPPLEQQLKIHLFLNSRGYMRGTVAGEFLKPPGGY